MAGVEENGSVAERLRDDGIEALAIITRPMTATPGYLRLAVDGRPRRHDRKNRYATISTRPSPCSGRVAASGMRGGADPHLFGLCDAARDAGRGFLAGEIGAGAAGAFRISRRRTGHGGGKKAADADQRWAAQAGKKSGPSLVLGDIGTPRPIT